MKQACMKGIDRLRKQEERKRLTWKIPLQRDGPKNETPQHRQVGDKCSNIEHLLEHGYEVGK